MSINTLLELYNTLFELIILVMCQLSSLVNLSSHLSVPPSSILPSGKNNSYSFSISQGRGGKGSIYVWASGDGGPDDDCNCDGYAASMWTISINSATNDGQTAGYDESCSSTLASTFSNGKSGYQDAGVVSLKDHVTYIVK